MPRKEFTPIGYNCCLTTLPSFCYVFCHLSLGRTLLSMERNTLGFPSVSSGAMFFSSSTKLLELWCILWRERKRKFSLPNSVFHLSPASWGGTAWHISSFFWSLWSFRRGPFHPLCCFQLSILSPRYPWTNFSQKPKAFIEINLGKCESPASSSVFT
jgi:hypothetical protein